MAITVIGGLVTSTLLSLLVVPAVFTYIDDFKNLFKRGVGRTLPHAPTMRKPSTEATDPATSA
jgi:predicted RND superfamily exporter protein